MLLYYYTILVIQITQCIQPLTKYFLEGVAVCKKKQQRSEVPRRIRPDPINYNIIDDHQNLSSLSQIARSLLDRRSGKDRRQDNC